MAQWKEFKEESEEETHQQVGNKVEVGKTPVVWRKDPSPERLANGKKTKYYFMPEGNFEKGSPYKCLICDYKSKSKSYLRLHFHKEHLKEKLYKCIASDFRQEKCQQVEGKGFLCVCNPI